MGFFNLYIKIKQSDKVELFQTIFKPNFPVDLSKITILTV